VPAEIAPRLAKLVAFAPAPTKGSSVLISINANAASLDAQ
jgi:hypothetical protein